MRIPKLVYWGSGIATVGCASVLMKDYLGGPKFDTELDMKGKVAVVTGANSGIGYHVAYGFAQRGAKVYLACRERETCETVREDIALETKNKNVYCRYCDLSKQDSIKRFVKRFHKDEEKLDILVNNAGVMWTPYSVTADGIETQLGVNHMGHFLLTNLLIDKLQKGAPSRIVNVSSTAHYRGDINVNDLNSVNKYSKSGAYNQSKLANVLFTRELARRLEGTGITVNAVHPGIVDTKIVRNSSYMTKTLMFIARPFAWPFIKSPFQGAQNVLHVALHPDLKDITGQYFNLREIKEPSPKALNDQLALWLWLVSEKWTKLSDVRMELSLHSQAISTSDSTHLPGINQTKHTNVMKGVPDSTQNNKAIGQPA